MQNLPTYIRLIKAAGLSRGGLRKRMIARLRAQFGNGPFAATFFCSNVALYLDNVTDQKVLMSSSIYNGEEIAFLRSHLPAKGTFVDIGANSGLISVGVLDGLPGVDLLAIEANPHMASRARNNLITLRAAGAGRREVIEAAVSDQPGAGFLNLANGFGEASILGASGDDTIEVKCARFCDILHENGFTSIDALKIDIEGHEETVIPDIMTSIAPENLPKAIVMEKPTVQDSRAVAALQAAGYTVSTETHSNLLMVKSA